MQRSTAVLGECSVGSCAARRVFLHGRCSPACFPECPTWLVTLRGRAFCDMLSREMTWGTRVKLWLPGAWILIKDRYCNYVVSALLTSPSFRLSQREYFARCLFDIGLVKEIARAWKTWLPKGWSASRPGGCLRRAWLSIRRAVEKDGAMASYVREMCYQKLQQASPAMVWQLTRRWEQE